ncbi:cytochrome P450 3A29-like [Diadema setosum]|uniref:cytochrome P450 3A29-like n=1 Tax=Diadema setosum TaxID=31175 RepID=UPI003B3B55A6
MAFTLLGFTISWSLVGALVALLVGREVWKLTYFKRHGIPGPGALPFLGNIITIGKKGFHFAFLEFNEKYGKVFGVFMFGQPVIVTSDPEMVREIAVKSFSNFINHPSSALTNRPFDKGLFNLKGQKWKNTRSIITPTFSGSKIRKMSDLVNECCDLLVRNIKGDRCEAVDVSRFFEAFTLDGIARCAFGLQVDSQNNPNDPFITNAKKIIFGKTFQWKTMLAGLVPPLAHLMNFLDVKTMPPDVINFFSSVTEEAISMRENKLVTEDQKDFLRLLINAHKLSDTDTIGERKRAEDVTDVHNRLDEHHNTGYFLDTKKDNPKLTKEEIVGQGLFFFIAGYETTSTTLGFIAYSLATNPEVQDKLIQEVDEVTPDRDSVNYRSIAKMTYLDGVVCETLRMYPPAALTNRICNETFTYKGVTIPKGMHVLLAVFSIHYNPEFWPNPKEFDPERFSKERSEGRHPFAWMPFGAGPRHCIGMRFALMEIKMAIVRLLQKFRFETCSKSEVPVKLGTRNVKPEKGIVLSVIERK